MHVFVRIGEAAVPGPWGIGAINSTGLTGKAELFGGLPSGIYACSETALTEVGQQRFTGELRSKCPKFDFHGGAPAPYRSSSPMAVGGKQVGVGFLTSCPFRPILQGWDQECYSTCRIAASRFFLGSEWVSGGVLYGYALKSDTREVQQATDTLLLQVAQKISQQSRGPRFIAGDFNQKPGVLETVQQLQAQGWADVQDLAQARWGIAPQPTCKMVSRKDFVLLSPELQGSLIGVKVLPDLFADHSVVVGIFRDQFDLPSVRQWPTVGQINWTQELSQKVRASTCHEPTSQEDQSKHAAHVFDVFEDLVHQSAKELGMPGLLPHQRGRAQHTDPISVRPQQFVIKASRRGEKQPLENSGLRYKRWFTQHRRLVNYVRLARVTNPTSSHAAHKLLLWKAIVNAPGFPQGFCHWWQKRATQAAGSPGEIPSVAPSLSTSEWISEAFAAELHQFEQALKPAQPKKFPLHAVFRDLKGPRPVPVQSLADRNVAIVQEVREDQSLIVDPPNVLVDHLPVSGPKGVAMPIHVDTDQIWLDQDMEVQAGDVVMQECLIGDLQQLHTRFEMEWFRRWDRHLHVPASRWNSLETFIDGNLPKANMDLSEISSARWHNFVLTRKKTSATGLDSVSRADLLAMPDGLIDSILSIYRKAENTGMWPRQWTSGAVHSLQKVTDAWKVQHFRPITVYPMPYRIWFSLLRFLHKIAPPSLWGNRTGASAVAFWWSLQFQIEQAMYEGRALSGYVLDIVKAFNMIPRDPIWRAAIHVGIPGQLVRAWAGFVSQSSRFFCIRQTYSRGLRSCTGYPEGCGLSVAGMFLANMVLHQWFSKLWPQLTFHSYVDNWEVIDAGESKLQEGLHTLSMLASLFDLELDADKSYAWSLSAADRKSMRNSGHKVNLAAKDLGGHMQYCRKRTNFTVTRACQALDSFWDRLGRSRAPQQAKLHAVRAAAWPRALHTISITSLSSLWFEKLRTAVTKSTNLLRSGSNPMIQLSLLESVRTDPEFFALWSSVLAFRRYACPDSVGMLFEQATQCAPTLRHPGPTGLLLTRLQNIGWSFVTGTIFNDHWGISIDILPCPPQELRWRITEGWQHQVGSRVMMRKHFDGLQCVAPQITLKVLQSFQGDERGLARAVLDGTNFTTDMPYCDENQCPLCQAADSLQHRHWECPKTEWSRLQITTSLADFPECVKDRGWAVLPSVVVDFRRALHAIPDTTSRWCCQVEPADRESSIDLFTDGAAICPQNPFARLTGWAVVELTGLADYVLVSYGSVPGLSQTVLRAEISALLSAIQYAKLKQVPTRIWCDNALVVMRAKAIIAQDFQVDSTTSDCDLWQILAEWATEDMPPITIHKVTSHVGLEKLSPSEQLVVTGNQWADAFAAEAIDTLPPATLRLQQESLAMINDMSSTVREVLSHIVRVGLQIKSLNRNNIETTDRQSMEQPMPPRPKETGVVIDLRCVVQCLRRRQEFPFDGLQYALLDDWANALSSAPAEPVLMTWYELLVSLQMIAKVFGVQKDCRGRWVFQRLLGAPFDFKRSGRTFGRFMRDAIQLTCPLWKPVNARPQCPSFRNWTGTAWVLCTVEWRDKIWSYFEDAFAAVDARRLGSALSHLKPAVEENEVPPICPDNGIWRYMVPC